MKKVHHKSKIRLVLTMVFSLMVFSLAGCGATKVVADYGNAEAFEAALNNGENLEGKIVSFTAGEIHPDSAAGYDIWAGEHLNFVSATNPDVKEGDIVTVRATTIENLLGSWLIAYEKVDNVVIGDTTITEVSGSGLNGATGNTDEADLSSQDGENGDALAVDEAAGTTESDAEESAEAETPADSEITIELVGMDAKAFKNYAGAPTMSAYIAIKNTSSVPITFRNISLDFEDNDGNLLVSDTCPQCIPEALKPGQTGYIYTYYLDLTGVNLDNGFRLKPNGGYKVADNFYEIEASDVSFKSGSFMDVEIIGRGTNNTGTEQSFAEPGAVFFDAEGNVVGFCYGLENFPDGQTTTFEISGDMMAENMSPDLVDHVEVYIQGNGW